MGIERITPPTLDVLEVLLEAHHEDVELHGWPIVKSTGRKSPTVYRVLDRLEDADWVTSRWEDNPDPHRPRRRLYKLTPTGRVEAAALVQQRRPQGSRIRLTPGWLGGEGLGPA